MSELPKPEVVKVEVLTDAMPFWPNCAPGQVFAVGAPPLPSSGVSKGWHDSSPPPRRMRASDFADKHGDWTQAGLDALAVVLRRAVERNRKAVGP